MTVFIPEAMKACDVDLDKLKFPCIIMPKIDGVRGYHSGEKFLARSGEPHPNLYTHNYFSDPRLAGIDSECVAGPITSPSLCRDTTSALNTIAGEPFVQCWCFDLVNEETAGMNYLGRLQALHRFVNQMRMVDKFHNTLRAVPYDIVDDIEKLIEVSNAHKNLGYEGSIIRSVDGKYKNGRATVREGTYLRLKSFSDAEIVVTWVEQGLRNENELQTDALGYAKRSTHQENMVGNGMVGAIWGELLQDIVFNGKTYPNLKKGCSVKIGAGRLSHDERKYYYEHQDELIGGIAKFQYFPHGMKDKLRFPTFIGFRMPQDL